MRFLRAHRLVLSAYVAWVSPLFVLFRLIYVFLVVAKRDGSCEKAVTGVRFVLGLIELKCKELSQLGCNISIFIIPNYFSALLLKLKV